MHKCDDDVDGILTGTLPLSFTPAKAPLSNPQLFYVAHIHIPVDTKTLFIGIHPACDTKC